MSNDQEEEIIILSQKISRADLKKMAARRFGDLVKAVVDVEKKIIAVGGELHADEEALLLMQGSRQQDLWGINLYPDNFGDAFIEFDSMINIRSNQDNRSRSVENVLLRQKILKVVQNFIE